ncbi:SDR family NAD(P)-dependent oxidoreductase [Jiella mangrovi]|uniref:SDR family oxidoreductase n=1 Tax=Jiella mangrovi TaxID=2821407 RepID=A0ABS4BJT0_9HYPH|nr:SDR family NAD(P)-dependent oxidoreductase [Jiella mangrovi]MBP0616990.1 SDR family oxidoreductase [Jiella mangrovi]
MQFDREFAGKGVVITGATGIYGKGLAETFAAQGAKLCLTDRDQNGLDKLLAELRPADGSFAMAADLKDATSIASLVAAVGERWQAPDIVVNNAGIYPSSFLLDMSVEDWDAVFDINLRAVFLLSKGFAVQMMEKGVKGSVLNISSGASRKMRRTACAYSTSKTALDRLTKGFGIELAEYGIRVNALEPGFSAGSTTSKLADAHVQRVLSAIPLGRPSSMDDIGKAALYLSSEAAAYVTGATLSVDGGNSIGSMDVYQDKKQAL